MKRNAYAGHAGIAGSSADLSLVYVGYSNTPGAGSYTATQDCVVGACLTGAGGSGGSTNGKGGSSGAALYKRFEMKAGQILSWDLGTGGVAGTSGTDGTDSTMTLPSGDVCTAGGGKANGLAGGAATGGDINRAGGIGGSSGAVLGDSVGAAGASPTNGGTGTNSNANNAGGAGAAGFKEVYALFPAGNGGAVGEPYSTVIEPGGGGAGSSVGGSTVRGGHGGISFVVMGK